MLRVAPDATASASIGLMGFALPVFFLGGGGVRFCNLLAFRIYRRVGHLFCFVLFCFFQREREGGMGVRGWGERMG